MCPPRGALRVLEIGDDETARVDYHARRFRGSGRPGRLDHKSCGPLAQLVEQLTLNQLVVGSIPTRPTNLSLLNWLQLRSERLILLVPAGTPTVVSTFFSNFRTAPPPPRLQPLCSRRDYK